VLLAPGECENRIARLLEAVEPDALKERTRERVPLDRAMTQNNLGNALLRLGQRESSTGHLLKAITCTLPSIDRSRSRDKAQAIAKREILAKS
jgi:hypothetical protein